MCLKSLSAMDHGMEVGQISPEQNSLALMALALMVDGPF
jgi:hypothetical protein